MLRTGKAILSMCIYMVLWSPFLYEGSLCLWQGEERSKVWEKTQMFRGQLLRAKFVRTHKTGDSMAALTVTIRQCHPGWQPETD